MWKKKNGATECDKSIVRCHVGTAQCDNETFKCEKKNESTTECDKSMVRCDIDNFVIYIHRLLGNSMGLGWVGYTHM